MRGCESDYRLGMSDDLHEDVASLGGEITLVAHLHAKIYLVDRREAIVGSANLTKGGIEDNYEAGLWICDPAAIKEICSFVDDLKDL
jgi:phosphatidylserine/phosphatidylglycerophosphate/cardiolipin synthase-like enzyme